MELFAGVWQFVAFLTTTRRGLYWLVVILMVLSVAGVVGDAMLRQAVWRFIGEPRVNSTSLQAFHPYSQSYPAITRVEGSNRSATLRARASGPERW